MLLTVDGKSKINLLTNPVLKPRTSSSDIVPAEIQLLLLDPRQQIGDSLAFEVQEALDEYHPVKGLKQQQSNMNKVEILPHASLVSQDCKQRQAVSQDISTLGMLIDMLEKVLLQGLHYVQDNKKQNANIRLPRINSWMSHKFLYARTALTLPSTTDESTRSVSCVTHLAMPDSNVCRRDFLLPVVSRETRVSQLSTLDLIDIDDCELSDLQQYSSPQGPVRVSAV